MSMIKREDAGFPILSGWWNRFFPSDFFEGGVSGFSATETTVPAANIKETASAYEIEVAAPGMAKDDFKITLDNNRLCIRSEKTYQKENQEDPEYSRQEFSYQSFQRTFLLPKDVADEDNILAKYKNGLLLLTIPKREAKQKPTRTIQIE